MSNIDNISKERALKLFGNDTAKSFETGTSNGLIQIHKYLFEGLYEFAGELRVVDISKGGFRFASHLYLKTVLSEIEKMPDSNFDEIIKKYVELNVAHPFRDGNGRSMRLWLDMLLKEKLQSCIDWQKIDKHSYLSAMERSPINDLEIRELLRGALTDKINDREVFMKGVEQSYYYEEEDFYK